MRFGAISPKDSTPHATIVVLPGLSEFGEKYFETARWALDNNFSFWVLDWMGQGLGGRYLENTQKRHATDFQDDIDDVHYFIMEYVKHASVSTDVGRIPFAMLAHSMGANIGLRYLQQHPDVFSCATFSAPMFGIKGLDPSIKQPLLALSSFLKLTAGNRYVPKGEDWHPEYGLEPEQLSSDPLRNQLMRYWMQHNPDLQVGAVTYGWVDAALKSCAKIQKEAFCTSIQTHCTIAKAGQDALVSGKAIDFVAKSLPHARLVELPDAQHEILIERDEIRNEFLDALKDSIQKNIIERPETLKPF